MGRVPAGTSAGGTGELGAASPAGAGRAEAVLPAAAARRASGQLGRFLELAARYAEVPSVRTPPSALRWPQPLRPT